MFPFLPFLSVSECTCERTRWKSEERFRGKNEDDYCVSHRIPSVLRVEFLKPIKEQPRRSDGAERIRTSIANLNIAPKSTPNEGESPKNDEQLSDDTRLKVESQSKAPLKNGTINVKSEEILSESRKVRESTKISRLNDSKSNDSKSDEVWPECKKVAESSFRISSDMDFAVENQNLESPVAEEDTLNSNKNAGVNKDYEDKLDESSATFEEAWPECKKVAESSFTMSAEMDFATKKPTDKLLSAEERTSVSNEAEHEGENAEKEKSKEGESNAKKQDVKIREDLENQFSKDEHSAAESVMSKAKAQETRNEVLLESEELRAPNSRCSSAASTSSSSLLVPQYDRKSTELRQNTPSPASSKSPRLSPRLSPRAQLPQLVNTPPGVRAARARQRAFRPSQAMLDIFGVDEATTSESNSDAPKKNAATNSLHSAPGPELVEPDAPNIVVSAHEDEQNAKKLSKTKRGIRTRNGIVDGMEAANEDVLVQAKIQLSDPGPEMASENEEIEESPQDDVGSAQKNERIEREDTLRESVFKCNENENFIIKKDLAQNEVNANTNLNDEMTPDEEEDKSDELREETNDDEEEEVEIIVEYDAFGRRFEKKRTTHKKSEKRKKSSKDGRALKEKSAEKPHINYNAHGRRIGHSHHHEPAGSISAIHHSTTKTTTKTQRNENHNNNNDEKTKEMTITTTAAAAALRKKTPHAHESIEKNNAENYYHQQQQQQQRSSSGRQQNKERQQRSALADILRGETTSEEAAKQKCKTSNAGGAYSGKGNNNNNNIATTNRHFNSQLQNLGDEPTQRKTPPTTTSPRSSATNRTSTNPIASNSGQDKFQQNANEKTSASAQNQVQNQAFGRRPKNSNSPGPSAPRQVGGGFGGGGGGGGGGAGGTMMNGTNNGTIESARGGGTGGGGEAEHVILIRQANVINDDEIYFADVLIEDGVISKISDGITAPLNAKTIDANGRWLLPAGIDAHTQFSRNSPALGGAFANGTTAALAGGTTTIIETVCPKAGETLAAAVDRIRKFADINTKCHYGISVVVGGTWNEQIRGQMTEVVCEKGVNSFLLDFHSDTGLFEALEHAKQLGAHCCMLPENPQIAHLLEKNNKSSDSALLKLEEERIQRYCVFSQLNNAPFSLLCIRTSAQTNDALYRGRRNGAQVSAEIPLKSLAYEYGSADVKSETDYALELLADSSFCTCISSDPNELLTTSKLNTTATNDSASRGFMAAVENRLSLLWEHGVTGAARLDPMRFVSVTSSNSAKLFNIYPKKGRVAVGSDADLVLWDFETPRKLGGDTIRCTPSITICGGEILVRDGKNCESQKLSSIGAKFVSLHSHSPYVFSMVQLKEKTFSLAELSISARKNTKVVTTISAPAANPDASRRTSLASSCASAATTGDALATAGGNERKPSGASVGNHFDTTANRPITAGTKNRNVQSTNPPKRSATKVIQPPGGTSTRFW